MNNALTPEDEIRLALEQKEELQLDELQQIINESRRELHPVLRRLGLGVFIGISKKRILDALNSMIEEKVVEKDSRRSGPDIMYPDPDRSIVDHYILSKKREDASR